MITTSIRTTIRRAADEYSFTYWSKAKEFIGCHTIEEVEDKIESFYYDPKMSAKDRFYAEQFLDYVMEKLF